MPDYDTARGALDTLCEDGTLTDDQWEALSRFVDLFKPYEGDDPAEARGRALQGATCTNCDHTQPVFAEHSSLTAAANTALRLNKCPRCYCTNLMIDF